MADADKETATHKTPPLYAVHLAIVLSQSIFGFGSVVTKLGVSITNPVLYALLREIISGPLLIICSCIIHKQRNMHLLAHCREHMKLFMVPSICLFLNQLFYIIGIKLSSSVTASAWQTSQGILAIIYGYCLGYEQHIDFYKLFGILLAFCGALWLLLFYTNYETKYALYEGIGSICFFINCSTTVCYLLFSKKVLRMYPSLLVLGYSYIFASCWMIVIAFIVYLDPAHILYTFLCPSCTEQTAWSIPYITMFSLLYSVLLKTFLSWFLMTWANQYTQASVNLAYAVLQPLTAALLSALLIVSGVVSACYSSGDAVVGGVCLNGPSWNDLGAIPIVIGLYLVVYSERKRCRTKRLLAESNTADDYGATDGS